MQIELPIAADKKENIMKKIKKTKEVHKHKKEPSNLSAHKAPSEIKISEAILGLSEPLRNKYKESHHLRGIISATVMAWNISLYPEDEQENVQDMLIDSLPEQMSGEDVATLLGCIDDLIARKKKYYPNVNDYIVKYDLSVSGDDITLTVGSAPINGKIKRKKID